MDDDTQAALLEQALALLSAAEKRLADQRERIAYLETMAMTDILTSLPNRREFEHTLLRTLATAQRYVESGALAFIDLDNFKTVNDTLGHEAGDCVLVHVAELLSENVRAADMVARLGGDEFVILMVRTAPEEAIKRARELQSMVNSSYTTFDATHIYVRASFGTVPYGPDSEAAELLNQADEAMYQDKMHRALPEPVASATSEAHPSKARRPGGAPGALSSAIPRPPGGPLGIRPLPDAMMMVRRVSPQHPRIGSWQDASIRTSKNWRSNFPRRQRPWPITCPTW